MASSWKQTIAPDWDEVDRIRREAEAFLKTQELAQDAVDALSMVACELTENAIKYGRFPKEPNGPDAAHITVTITTRRRRVLVEVKNPIGTGNEEHMARFDAMIQWIRGYQDPYEAYLERLKDVSKRTLEDTESGLGLVRIAYEGQSILDFYVDDQNQLAVSAVFERPAAASPTTRSQAQDQTA